MGISAVGLQLAPLSWEQGEILLLLTQVIPCCLRAGFPVFRQLGARAPGRQLPAVVNPKPKAKLSHGKKKMQML